jgi:hypothetical protein
VSEGYIWRSGSELWIRYNINSPIQILIIQPFFEESNRCRHLLTSVMRGLATNGIGSVLPDLPGSGESSTDISSVTFGDWQDAVKAAAEKVKPTVVAAFRGGALLDAAISAKGHWRFVPETGVRIVRDLRRTKLTGNALYAGHAISDDFLGALETVLPSPLAPLRTVRLENDAGEADARVTGSPLWRRAEPGDDPELAFALVSDLTDWVKQCAGC